MYLCLNMSLTICTCKKKKEVDYCPFCLFRIISPLKKPKPENT